MCRVADVRRANGLPNYSNFLRAEGKRAYPCNEQLGRLDSIVLNPISQFNIRESRRVEISSLWLASYFKYFKDLDEILVPKILDGERFCTVYALWKGSLRLVLEFTLSESGIDGPPTNVLSGSSRKQFPPGSQQRLRNRSRWFAKAFTIR